LAILVLLIVATAIMFAWLLGSVTRFALSDLRLRMLHPSLEHEGPGEPGPMVAMPEDVPPEPRVDPELDAERAVREHLYGRREPRT
jgi:hypothetical protein